MNFCTSCNQDFSSERLFDKHRTGPHDGERRCRPVSELKAMGLSIDKHGRWADPVASRKMRAAFGV